MHSRPKNIISRRESCGNCGKKARLNLRLWQSSFFSLFFFLTAEEIMKSTDTVGWLQIGAVHAHQPNNNHHQHHQQQQQQQQQQPSSQPQVPGAGAGAAGGPGGGVARAGGMFCYHCPPGLPAPRLPPSLEYPFAPTHPCK